MQCLYLVFVGCFILAADALSGSNNDAEFVAGVSSKLFGKCFGKYNCQVERDALEKASGMEEICRKAEQYTQCYSTEKACNTSDGFNNLTKLGDDLKNRFCALGNTNPSPETTTGSSTTTASTTPAPTTTGSSTTTASTTPAPTTTGSYS
ncbi:uncharacterized protein LOC131929904 [Physella acuta]|uniref:uncharacterized protein LOC131929904 n=1 Tax=Physella acuta TaxID=109671 RepID=UPI0027DE9815|nr:uncharacterized protein LOC131929904 [Physella acuta]